MKRATLALLGLGLLLGPTARAHDEDPVEAALREPRATGLLVMMVYADTQSWDAGIVAGDIVLSYDGTAVSDLASLSAAKEAAEAARRDGSNAGPIPCVIRRAADGAEVEVALAPGQLGLQLVPVTADRPPSPLPADTGAPLRAADAGARDEWFALSMGGTKCGMEHVTVRVEGELLHFTHEVAFDGGPEWGLHHGIVRATIRCGTTARPVAISYENGLNGWISRSRVERDEEGRPVWRATGGIPGQPQNVTEMPLLDGASTLPSYAVAQIARLLPREEGACLRFRPVSDWDGAPGLPAAIVCVGPETVKIGETEHAAWKFEQRQLGGNTLGTYWFDAERRLVQAAYGGPLATAATKEAALEGLSPELTPRTAD